MKIGIDARFVGPEGTGIGKYTEKLILNLQKIDKKNQYVIFLNEENWQYLIIQNKNFKKKLANVSWYSTEEQVKMPTIFNKENLDLVHIPHFNAPILYRKKFIVTIHDLTHQKFSTADTTTKSRLIFKFKKIGYRKVISHAVRNSQKIITPSMFVKKELINEFKIDPRKIIVTYEAAEEEYFTNQKPKIINHKPKLLYVGNAYPHKNLKNLIKAVKLINEAVLYIVCPRDTFSNRLNKFIESQNMQSKIKLHGYMHNKELVKMFNMSSLYVFPSKSEGFGIPGLNAMAANLPLTASNIETFKEIYKDAAVYFDPDDPKNMASKIQNILSSEKLRESLVKKEATQVNKYSWKRMSEQTLKAYEDCFSTR